MTGYSPAGKLDFVAIDANRNDLTTSVDAAPVVPPVENTEPSEDEQIMDAVTEMTKEMCECDAADESVMIFDMLKSLVTRVEVLENRIAAHNVRSPFKI